jgi:hypothetical protein
MRQPCRAPHSSGWASRARTGRWPTCSSPGPDAAGAQFPVQGRRNRPDHDGRAGAGVRRSAPARQRRASAARSTASRRPSSSACCALHNIICYATKSRRHAASTWLPSTMKSYHGYKTCWRCKHF